MARRGYYEERDAADRYAWEQVSDVFGEALLGILEEQGDIASEATWQRIPRLIAQKWGTFTKDQSPLSTMNMISRCAETVLKIRLASRKGGGEEESRRLEEFQALMGEIFAGEGGGDEAVYRGDGSDTGEVRGGGAGGVREVYSAGEGEDGCEVEAGAGVEGVSIGGDEAVRWGSG